MISLMAADEYYYNLERAIFSKVVNKLFDRLLAIDNYFSIAVYIQIYNIRILFVSYLYIIY